MSGPSFLIDTNVFIGLEDTREVSPQFASILQLAAKHGVAICIHEVARDDIQRDRDEGRRRVSLSKIEKFRLIGRVRGLTTDQLAEQFGPVPKPNDIVDATLLHALRIGVADFLVTEDAGLHDRARRYASDLSRRVLFVADAASLLRTTYEPVGVPVRFVEEVDANTIPGADSIFDSLREGYPDFDAWWRERCVRQQRKCWVVTDGTTLTGIVVRKDETRADTTAKKPGDRILKICTFKVRPESRGTKLGELLLKQVLWFAQKNRYELVYLTTFHQQAALIDLLCYYGFEQTNVASNGEITFEKALSDEPVSPVNTSNLFALDCREYPRFYAGPDITAYGIPIQEPYHDVLFPDLREPDLFEFGGIGGAPRTPGNTIRKVYLCRAQAMIDRPGALLFFYKSKSERLPSQAFTAVGIFEDMTLAESTEDLRRLAGGRSVYSETQLERWQATSARPVKVINFLLGGYFQPPMGLRELQRIGVLKGAPQSIFRIAETSLSQVLGRLDLGFRLQ